MTFAPIHSRRRLIVCVLLASGLAMQPGLADAETALKPIPTQYIAALGDRGATSGTGAEAWGQWRLDPGARGVRLTSYEALTAAGGVAPARWCFDGADWWLEGHGLIMEAPEFPLPPARYVVTGGREVTAILTVHPKGDDGVQHWELDQGTTLHDARTCAAAPRGTGRPQAPGPALPPRRGRRTSRSLRAPPCPRSRAATSRRTRFLSSSAWP